jgi:hypothetical protein
MLRGYDGEALCRDSLVALPRAGERDLAAEFNREVRSTLGAGLDSRLTRMLGCRLVVDYIVTGNFCPTPGKTASAYLWDWCPLLGADRSTGKFQYAFLLLKKRNSVIVIICRSKVRLQLRR